MPKKKNFVVGLGGLKVIHSGGDQEFAKTRYHASEPGMYAPPEMMMLGKSEPDVAPEPKKKKTTTAKQDAELKKAAKNDLSKRNLKNNA